MNYDTIYDNIKNLAKSNDQTISCEPGTVTSIVIGACAASIAGAFGAAESVARMLFADICDRPELERWATILGVSFLATDEDYLLRQRVLDRWKMPPTGAKKSDWDTWIKGAMQGSEKRYRIAEKARGIGSMDIVLGLNATSDDMSNVTNAINNNRPLGMVDYRVTIATGVRVSITLVCSGLGIDVAALRAEILSRYHKDSGSHLPGMNISRSRIEALAVQFGADSVILSNPLAGGHPAELTATGDIIARQFVTGTDIGQLDSYDHLYIDTCSVVVAN